MTPGIPEPERTMRASCRAHSLEIQSLTRMEAMQASSKREDNFGVLADHVISEEHPAEEERSTHAESAILVVKKR